MSEQKYGVLADRVADRYEIPRGMFRRMLTKESGWDTTAIGDGGRAVGLGQLHTAAAQEVGLAPGERKNPWKNLEGSGRYLRRQFDLTGGWRSALARYNQGPSGAYDSQGNLTKKGLDYADSIFFEPGTRRGTQAAGTTPMGVSAPRAEDIVVKEGCSGFSPYSPSTWAVGVKCAFAGLMLPIIVAALVVYAARQTLG